MSETTPPDSQGSTARAHLQAVDDHEEAASPSPSPARGNHLTGLLLLLLVAVLFAFLAQFSSRQALQAEVTGLRQELSTALTELEGARGRLTRARDMVGGLHQQLDALEAELAADPAAPEMRAAGGESAP